MQFQDEKCICSGEKFVTSYVPTHHNCYSNINNINSELHLTISIQHCSLRWKNLYFLNIYNVNNCSKMHKMSLSVISNKPTTTSITLSSFAHCLCNVIFVSTFINDEHVNFAKDDRYVAWLIEKEIHEKRCCPYQIHYSSNDTTYLHPFYKVNKFIIAHWLNNFNYILCTRLTLLILHFLNVFSDSACFLGVPWLLLELVAEFGHILYSTRPLYFRHIIEIKLCHSKRRSTMHLFSANSVT